MFEKQSIKDMGAYKTNEFVGYIRMDANEGRLNLIDGIDLEMDLNFYPDNECTALKEKISNYVNVSVDNILCGNGSSEMIDLLFKAFVDKGENVISFVPSFSMYSVYSKIYGANFIGVKSEEDFSLDIDKLIEKAINVKPKLILVCNPNNPTGALISKDDIRKLVNNVKDSLIVLDEAYMEFSKYSFKDEFLKYSNVIVLKTLSKAISLAGIRVGYMLASEDIINIANKVRPPYNLNSISQYMAIKSLENIDKLNEYIQVVNKERNMIYEELENLNQNPYESHTNFVFFKPTVKDLNKKMFDHKILIRDFGGELSEYYRVSVGTEDENKLFISALKEIIENEAKGILANEKC